MNTSLIVLLVLAALALFVAMAVIGIYNKLVELRNRFKNAFAQIDVHVVGADGVIQEREARIAPRHRRDVGLSDPAVGGERRNFKTEKYNAG